MRQPIDFSFRPDLEHRLKCCNCGQEFVHWETSPAMKQDHSHKAKGAFGLIIKRKRQKSNTGTVSLLDVPLRCTKCNGCTFRNYDPATGTLG